MMASELKKLTDSALLENTHKLVGEERKINIKILHHLKEIQTRSLHLKLGFSSLFDYCTNSLKYSESQAQRRITAMRLVQDIPEVEDKIKSGLISLTNASKIQSFLSQEEKYNKPLTQEAKLELIEKLENKSSRECERELIKLSPESIVIKEKERIVSEDLIELKVTVDKNLKAKLERVKGFLSHTNPEGKLTELLDQMCDLVIKLKDPSAKWDKAEQQVKQRKSLRGVSIPPQVTPHKGGRYIPIAIKREVYTRDQGSCSFTDPQSKRRCNSKHLIQYDHIWPLSLNGQTSTENLRLLCFNHHQLVTKNIFGT
ncbi:MAG: HNH endonuclease [Oligoflexia bacterium]|nr:HNH endonuclease [Oligoflexia bacterium]